MGRPRYRVVISDCDHGSVEEEKEEFGGMGAESISELKRRTARNVADVLRGRKPHSVVNREVLAKTRALISSD